MVQFLIPGLVLGGIYALAALGLVSTYLSAGVLNFAYGALAFFIARFYYFLHSQHGWGIVPSAIVAIVLTGPLLGLLLWAVLFRGLARSSTLVKVAATIGLSVAIPPLAQLLFGKEEIYSVPGLAPDPVPVYHVGAIALSLDQVIVLASVAVILVAGVLLLRFTRFGLTVRAVVDSARMARLSGINPQVVAAAVWTFSLFLAGLVGVLVAPIVGLAPDNFTLLIATAFTAVVIAKLRSPGVAVVAAILVGVATAVVQRFTPPDSALAQQLVPAIPFAFVALFILLGSRGVAEPPDPAEAELGDRLARDDDERGQWRFGGLPVVPTLAAVALVAAPLVATGYWVGLIGEGIVFAIIFLSYTLLSGEGGFISLAQVTFAGVGALATAQLVTSYGVDPMAALLISVVVAVVVGLLLGLLTVRLGGLYVALITLTFALLMDSQVFNLDSFAQFGAGVDAPRPRFADNDLVFAYLAMAILLVCAGIVVNLRHSTTGLALAASRWSASAARSLGINATAVRIACFGLSAGIAAAGGALLGMFHRAVIPGGFSTLTGLVWFTVLVACGVRTISAAVVAGIAFTVLPALVVSYLPTSLTPLPTLLFGLAAIGMIHQPDGVLTDVGRSLRRAIRGRPAKGAVPETAGEVSAR